MKIIKPGAIPEAFWRGSLTAEEISDKLAELISSSDAPEDGLTKLCHMAGRKDSKCNALLACPFCGEQAVSVTYATGIPQTCHPGARCDNPDCFLFGYHWPASKWQKRKQANAAGRDRRG
jgi:hypothetical protein